MKPLVSSFASQPFGPTHFLATLRWVLLLALLILPQMLLADSWQVKVGAQSHNKGHQAIAFLPNEIWIHAGDSVTWTLETDEIHTVTFLVPGQIRPPFIVGCPGVSPNGSSFDNSTCVTSGVLVRPKVFTVNFPSAGNFKLVCLVHRNMSGVVHVLDQSALLPHGHEFYEEEGEHERHTLLSDTRHEHNEITSEESKNVSAGLGEVSATPGGQQTLAVMRFMEETKVVHVGDTVEWGNPDSTTPHTITFGGGPDPANPVLPSPDVTLDADGARHAILNSPTDVSHSGFIVPAPQEKTGSPQNPLTVTRFRVTFPKAGEFPYRCVLHDNLGMMGKVIVLP